MICPKCKTEFVDGVTHCSDCKIPLVASLEVNKELVPFMELAIEPGQKLVEFLRYSGLHAEAQVVEEEQCLILVGDDEEKQAKKLATIFIQEEAKRNPLQFAEESAVQEDLEEPEEQQQEEKGTYALAKDRYEDAKGTFWILLVGALICTGIGLKNTIVHFDAIIHFTYNGFITYLVLWFISILLIWGTVKYKRITKEIYDLIAVEAKWDEQVSNWMNETFTATSVQEALLAQYGTVQEEIFILNRYNYLKQAAVNQFPDIPVGFLELIIDTFCEETFE